MVDQITTPDEAKRLGEADAINDTRAHRQRVPEWLLVDYEAGYREKMADLRAIRQAAAIRQNTEEEEEEEEEALVEELLLERIWAEVQEARQQEMYIPLTK